MNVALDIKVKRAFKTLEEIDIELKEMDKKFDDIQSRLDNLAIGLDNLGRKGA